MDLSAARTLIDASLRRMDAVYGQPVFNEWAVVSLTGRPAGGTQGLPAPRAAVLAYSGPRVENFHDRVRIDSGPLCSMAAARPVHEGDFEFAIDAAGTHFDAFMRLGAASYLVCNHTEKTFADIRADPRWLKAQKEFFALGEKFRVESLAL